MDFSALTIFTPKIDIKRFVTSIRFMKKMEYIIKSKICFESSNIPGGVAVI